MDHTATHTRTTSAFTPAPQSVTALCLVLTAPTHEGMARLKWPRWLITYQDSLNLMPPAPLYLRTLWRYTNAVIIIIKIDHVHQELNPDMVTDPSTNWARHRLTSSSFTHYHFWVGDADTTLLLTPKFVLASPHWNKCYQTATSMCRMVLIRDRLLFQ